MNCLKRLTNDWFDLIKSLKSVGKKEKSLIACIEKKLLIIVL